MITVKAHKRDHIFKYTNEVKYDASLKKFHDQLIVVCFCNMRRGVFSVSVTCYVRIPSQVFQN